MIRKGCLALLIVITAGCTSVTDEVKATVAYAFKDTEDATLTPEEINDFPYTSLYAQWVGKPRNLIVLGYVDASNKRHFITAEKETLVLNRGRVIRTQRLNENLLSVSHLTQDPLRCIVSQPEQCQTHWTRTHDYKLDNGQRVSRSVQSVFYVKERKTLNMPYGKADAVLVEENGEFVFSGDTFTNRFWVEADGHVIKSEQQVFIETPMLKLTQVTWIGRTNNTGTAE